MMQIKKDYFFKTVNYILDVPDTKELKKVSGKASRIMVLSYYPINLPGWKIKIKDTTVIDLGGGVEKVFSQFNHTARNEIKKTEKISGLIIKVDEKFSEEGYKIYCEHEIFQGRAPLPRKDFFGCLFFNAILNNEVISVITVFPCKQIMRIKTISSKRLSSVNDKERIKIIGSASRRLIWEICLYGIKHNKKGVDLAYINLSDSTKQGITQFKMSFGGSIVKEYAYFYESLVYRIFKKLVPFRLFLKNFFRF